MNINILARNVQKSIDFNQKRAIRINNEGGVMTTAFDYCTLFRNENPVRTGWGIRGFAPDAHPLDVNVDA
jgi:hypothetical protein